MPEEPREDVSVFEEIETLTKECESFKARKAEAEAKILELRASEDLAAGKYFAKEIFHAQQDKLRLETEMQIISNKIKRLRMGLDPAGTPR